jgi:hypothetical protein
VKPKTFNFYYIDLYSSYGIIKAKNIENATYAAIRKFGESNIRSEGIRLATEDDIAWYQTMNRGS